MQGDLEDALERILSAPVPLVCAGRTDSGVHALGQVVSCSSAPDGLDTEGLLKSLNGMLGPRIAVTGASAASEGWHARFSALSRTYVYALFTAQWQDPFLSRTTLHHPGALDLDAMNEAAGHLLGPHDFSSFGRPLGPAASAGRVLYELACTRRGDIVRLRARANAFIQQMMRSLVGTLVYVGEGRRSPGDLPGILEARDRAASGPVAAPHGLCLVAVEYDEGWSGSFGGNAV